MKKKSAWRWRLLLWAAVGVYTALVVPLAYEYDVIKPFNGANINQMQLRCAVVLGNMLFCVPIATVFAFAMEKLNAAIVAAFLILVAHFSATMGYITCVVLNIMFV